MIGVSDASSISIGRILSPMMWFGHIRDNRSCQRRLSFGHLCCADHSRIPWACIEDRGKPGWERLRMICARSTWAWRRRAMDRPAWRLLVDAAIHPRDTLQRERERERDRQSGRGWRSWQKKTDDDQLSVAVLVYTPARHITLFLDLSCLQICI